jgi:hypothetical protein
MKTPSTKPHNSIMESKDNESIEMYDREFINLLLKMISNIKVDSNK